MKKYLEERDSDTETLQEKLAKAQNYRRKSNEDVLQQHRTQDEIIKSQMDKVQSYKTRYMEHRTSSRLKMLKNYFFFLAYTIS